MQRTVLVGLVVFTILLVGCIIAIAVLAVRLHDETSGKSDDDEKVDKEILTDCDDVAVIGAGVTGSYAAWRLRQRNLKVSLYEYSARIGGRCFTVQLPGIPDVNVELGAMRYRPTNHPLFNRTVHELGLHSVDFDLGYGASGGSLYYLRGKHMRYEELPEEAPYNLPAEQRVDLATVYRNLFSNSTKSSAEGLTSLEGVNLRMQSSDLFKEKYVNSETVHYLKDSSVFLSAHGPDVAASYFPASLTFSTPIPEKSVVEGFQAVPEKMVEQFLDASNKHSFYRNHHLRSITKQDDGNYVLTFQPTETKAGVTTDIKGSARIQKCAKKVILTIPRMALEHLDWEGLEDETVQDYLKHAVTDKPAAKMFFGYPTAWWRQLEMTSSYLVSTTPLRQTYEFAVSASTSQGVLGPSYTDGDTRIWREAVKSGTRVPGVGDNSIAMTDVSVYLTRKYLAEVYNISLDEVAEPDSAVMAIWDQYPVGMAWYVWAPGYNWEEVEARMLKPSADDDVYIASNIFSTTFRAGWMEGGLEMVEKVLQHF